MKQTLWLVWDTSGSMAENGKRFIARGVAREMEQFCRFGYGSADLKLVSWANEAQLIEWSPKEEFPAEMLVCEGAAKAEALNTFLGKQPTGKVLIITDGFWSPDDEKVFKRWKSALSKDTLRFIKIGADANPQLKGPEVFTAEELFAALDGWLEGGSL